jgi:hypothetical protein
LTQSNIWTRRTDACWVVWHVLLVQNSRNAVFAWHRSRMPGKWIRTFIFRYVTCYVCMYMYIIYICVCVNVYTYAQQSAHQNIMHQIQLRSIPCPPPSESASRDFSCLFSRWRWTVSWSRTPVNSGSHTHNVNQCHAWTTSWKMSSICHQSR